MRRYLRLGFIIGGHERGGLTVDPMRPDAGAAVLRLLTEVANDPEPVLIRVTEVMGAGTGGLLPPHFEDLTPKNGVRGGDSTPRTLNGGFGPTETMWAVG